MGFFSNLFKGKQAKNPQEKLVVWVDCDEEDEFEREYGAKIRHLEERVDEATWTDSENPDVQLRAYDRALDLCDELEDFCSSCGSYGRTYFSDHCADLRPRIEKWKEMFLNGEYQEKKKEWDNEQQEKRKYAALKHKILKFISGTGGAMRKEIYGQFPEERQEIILKALNELVDNGKIEKQKDKKRLLFVCTQK